MLLMQRMDEVLTPKELNLVRCYHGIGRPDEVGMTFQELAIYLNYNGPGGAERGIQGRAAETEKESLFRRIWTVACCTKNDPRGQGGSQSEFQAVHSTAEDMDG